MRENYLLNVNVYKNHTVASKRGGILYYMYMCIITCIVQKCSYITNSSDRTHSDKLSLVIMITLCFIYIIQKCN